MCLVYSTVQQTSSDNLLPQSAVIKMSVRCEGAFINTQPSVRQWNVESQEYYAQF